MVTLGTEQCGCCINYAEEGFMCLILWDLWIAQNLWSLDHFHSNEYRMLLSSH